MLLQIVLLKNTHADGVAVHRRAEFQIIISPEFQGKGLASKAAKLAMDYGFTVLNLYKLYLIVDKCC